MGSRNAPMIAALATFVVCQTLAAGVAAERTKRAESWILTGGPSWEARVGPGFMIGVGGNDCTDEHCDDDLDSSFAGSLGGTLGFFYRIVPNLVVFADVHLGYMKTGIELDLGQGQPGDLTKLTDNQGMLFQAVAGAEFRGPLTGWLDAAVGLGVGYAHLKASGKYDDAASGEITYLLKGLDFELRTGVDVYPFSAAPTLAFGVLFRLGLVYWPEACVDHESSADSLERKSCTSPGDADWLDADELPFLVHLGLVLKYGF